LQLEALRREIELRMKASVAGGQTVSSEVSRLAALPVFITAVVLAAILTTSLSYYLYELRKYDHAMMLFTSCSRYTPLNVSLGFF